LPAVPAEGRPLEIGFKQLPMASGAANKKGPGEGPLCFQHEMC
jgi:hypothetical protein